jgi:hypothetical protein
MLIFDLGIALFSLLAGLAEPLLALLGWVIELGAEPLFDGMVSMLSDKDEQH